MDRQTDMTQGPILREIAAFARPLLLTSVLQQTYSMADAVIIRMFAGIEAFAAIGAAGTLLWIFEDMLLGLTQSFGVVYAQLFGAKEKDGLSGALKGGMYISAIAALLFAAVLFFFRVPLFTLFATPDELMGGACAYTVSMLLFIVSCAFFYNAASFLRASGDSRTPLIATFISSLMNIALDLLLAGKMQMGAAGAGLATGISECAALTICLVRIRETNTLAGIRAGHWDRLLHMGLPSMARDGVISMGGGIVQRVVNGFGVAVIAGVAASKKFFTMLQTCGSALEGCAATFAGQNTGAGKEERIKEGTKVLVLTDLVTAALTALIAYICARPLIGFVLGYGDAAALECGIAALRWAAVFLPSLYILCTLRAILQNMGFAAMAMGSGFCELLARAVVCALLPVLIGETSAYVAEEAGWLITAIYLAVCLVIAKRMKDRRAHGAAR